MNALSPLDLWLLRVDIDALTADDIAFLVIVLADRLATMTADRKNPTNEHE